MALVTGPGGNSGAGFRPESGPIDKAEEAKQEQGAQELQDINKKTDVLKTTVKVERDAFAVKDSNAFSVDKKSSDTSREKILSSTLPEALTLVEQTFDVEINAEKLFKMKNQTQNDPTFKNDVREMRANVEQWAKEALRAVENKPAVVELPKIDLAAAKKSALQEQSQQQKAATDPQKVEPPKIDAPKIDAPKIDEQKLKVEPAKVEPPKTDALKADTLKADSAKTDATKADTAKADAAKSDTAKADAASDTTKAQQTNTDTAADDTKKAGSAADTAKADAAKTDTAATDAAKPDAAADAAKADAAKDAAAADLAVNDASNTDAAKADAAATDAAKVDDPNAAGKAAEPPPVAETGDAKETKDDLSEGSQALAAEDADATTQAPAADDVAKDDAATNVDPQAQRMAVAMYNLPADASLAITPEQKFLTGIMPTPVQPLQPGEEPRFDVNGIEIADQQYFDTADAIMNRLGPSPELLVAYNTSLYQLTLPVPLTPANSDLAEGSQKLGGVGGSGGSSPETFTLGQVSIGSSDGASGLGGGDDIMIYAMLVLIETLKDLDDEIKTKITWSRVRHQANDMMRAHMADVMKKMATLKAPNPNGEELPEGMFIENLHPEVTVDDKGNPTVQMVPEAVETPYSTRTAESNGDNTPKPVTAETQVQQIRDLGAKEHPPITQTERTENGTIFVTSTHTYVTIDHLNIEKERLNNEIQQLKMDFEKEILSVQKTMSNRKNVFDNLNKMIKSKSEEWGKSVAMIRR